MESRIPDNVYRRDVQGLRLRPGSLADQLDPASPTLLVFLRHFGCPFCKEAVADLRAIAEKDPSYPPVLFFSQSCAAEAVEFFEKHWPEARVVCDPDKAFYSAMGLRQGTFGQVWGLRVWTCSFRALAKGHVMSKPIGDPWLMPGVFLVRGQEILWCHVYEHQGDNPDWSKIPSYLSTTSRSEVAEHSGS
jgi:AhpC/TSA antioxidant enzyme